MKLKAITMGIFAFIATVLGCKGQTNFNSVDPETFEQLLNGDNVVCLDVRTSDEYNEARISGAINIDVQKSDFEKRATELLPKQKTIAVYCRSGRRSKAACRLLVKNGYNVVDLDSGIIGWKRANKKVAKEGVITYTSPHGVNFEQHSFKHASLGIRIDNTWLYVDPVTDKVQPATDYTQMPKADIILITHEHADHLDTKAIEQLTKDETVVIANPRSAEILGGKCDVMRNGDTKNVKNFAIEAVPAYNTSADKQQFHPKGRDNGYVLTVDDLRVYIAGDTEDIAEMEALKDIDIAFLPCNLPFTMSPEQFVRAAKSVNAKLLFVYHYGQTDTKQVQKLLEENGIKAIIRPYM